MNQVNVHRPILALIMAGAGTRAAVQSDTASAASANAAKAQKFKGTVEEMPRWGPLQVTITVKSKKITNAQAAVSPHTPRSEFINEQAIPILRQETLEAQSANIDLVSGATDTSEAYITSLQSAINKARKAKKLK